MTKPRIVETNQGIQGEFNVTVYDQMMKRLRDKGWMETSQIIKSGIDKGLALEVGPGPGSPQRPLRPEPGTDPQRGWRAPPCCSAAHDR